MADLKLDILVVPTYNTKLIGIADASTYPSNPSSPSIEITVPSFGVISLPFNINDYNIFNSTSLGITSVGEPIVDLPDGIYNLKYSITPAYVNYVNKTIIRIDKLQEKFDSAFMKLDMMECDRALKTQSKVTLSTIQFLIQGAVSAANECAEQESNKLYNQANYMLDNFIKNNCGCSGNNYINNF